MPLPTLATPFNRQTSSELSSSSTSTFVHLSIRTARLPPASPSSRGDRGRAKTPAAPSPDVATSRRSTCPLYRYSATTIGRSAQLTCLPRSVDGRNCQPRTGPGHGLCPAHAPQSLCKHTIFADISASCLHCATTCI